MNPRQALNGCGSSGARMFSWKRLSIVPLLAACGALLTGCPHNDYTVELKPTGNAVERTLTFYRADGSSNGVPNYLEFSTNELAAISKLYPSGAVKPDGQRYVARGEFAGTMPGDVGGSGSCLNWTTSLGDSGMYMERFRGNDDLAARTARQYAAADQITDLIIGWSRAEFGRERGWKKLRQFLDHDFRHDLKNAARYFQLGAAIALSGTNAMDEFTARLSQYLLERNYLGLPEAGKFHFLAADKDAAATLLKLARNLVAGKMGFSSDEPLPESFAVFAGSDGFKKSWELYLAKTGLYRAQVKDWEKNKKSNPKLEKPRPADAMDGLVGELLTGASGNGGETDHLTVKLALDCEPRFSNGRWKDGQVVWEADLDPNRALPVFCFAGWINPRAGFQTDHFGRVILTGLDLASYCLWQNGLDAKLAAEWEAFLAGLQPGPELKEKLESFQFASQSDSGRRILIKALSEVAKTNSVSK